MNKEAMDTCTESKDSIIKNRLISARKMRDISQTELAHRCGLTSESISLLESGAREPCVSSLLKLAVALEVSVDYLMGIRSQPTGGQVRDSFTKLFNRLLPQERKVVRSLVEVLIAKKTLQETTPFFDAKESL